jgi:hypothetical protein
MDSSEGGCLEFIAVTGDVETCLDLDVPGWSVVEKGPLQLRKEGVDELETTEVFGGPHNSRLEG